MVDPISHDIFVIAENFGIYRFTPPSPGSTTTLQLYFDLSSYTGPMDGFAIGCDGTLYVAYDAAILVISKSSSAPPSLQSWPLDSNLCQRPDGIAVAVDYLLMACNEKAVLLSLDASHTTQVVTQALTGNTGDEVYVAEDGCAYIAYDDMVKLSPCHFCNTEHLLIVLSQLPATTVCGNPVTFTATANDPTATGTVTFYAGSRSLGTSPLLGGVAQVTTDILVAGDHQITATYKAPTAPSKQIQDVLHHLVKRYAPKIQITQSDPSGSPVTFTGTVTGRPADHITGNLSFYDEDALLGERGMTNQVAQLTTDQLDVGNRTIKVTFPGDKCYKGVSASLQHIIKPLTVTLSQNPATTLCKNPATFTATSSDPSLTAIVSFYAGSKLIGNAAFTHGVAHISTSVLEAGDYKITAHYKHGTDVVQDILDSLDHKVLRFGPKLHLTQSSPSSDKGTPVTFTATVTARPTDQISGPIKFYDGDTVLGTATMTNHVAKFTTTKLPVGNRTIKATYPGTTCLKGVSAGLHHIVDAHVRFASWDTNVSGTLNADNLHISYNPESDANTTVVPEAWKQSPDFSFDPDTAAKEDAISVANNVSVTITFSNLGQTPLLYFKLWTIGTYIFSDNFNVKSTNGDFFTKTVQADGTVELVVTKGLSGILEFPTTTTHIHWSATPKNDVRQIYFTVAIPH